MPAPAWLKDIQLVTFDCFGTLMDWRTAFEKVEIRSREDFDKFETEAAKLGEQDQYLRYTEVLKTAIGRVRPQLRPAIVGLFADDFGRMAPFADAARALHAMRDVVKVGVLANCDASHQLDVIATLRMPWDVCITSQELRAYKPTDRAWDAMLRIGVARSAATRDSWMHVAASPRQDLVPARARGLKTCFLKRPGGDERATADLTVTNLDELATLVQQAKQGPLLVEVESVAQDSAVRDQLRAWLQQFRLGAMREVPGVRAATLFEREDGLLIEQYVFGGRQELDAYTESWAAEHRAAMRDEFGQTVQRTQRVSTIRARS
jgi:2-haloacid dehalogenase